MTSHVIGLWRRGSDGKRARSLARIRLVPFLLAVVAALDALVAASSVVGWFGLSQALVWSPPPMLVPATTGAVVCLLAAVAAWLAGRPASAAIRGAAATLAVESVFTAALLLMHLQGYSLIGPVAPGIAFIVALVLTLCLAATVALFWPVSKLTASLLLPAALWMLYLSFVNGVAALLTLS